MSLRWRFWVSRKYLTFGLYEKFGSLANQPTKLAQVHHTFYACFVINVTYYLFSDKIPNYIHHKCTSLTFLMHTHTHTDVLGPSWLICAHHSAISIYVLPIHLHSSSLRRTQQQQFIKHIKVALERTLYTFNKLICQRKIKIGLLLNAMPCLTLC